MTTMEQAKPDIIQPGFYHGTRFANYAAWDAVNWHTLEPFRRSSKHGRHAMLTRAIATETQDFGEAFHTAILEPDRFASEYVVMPEFAGHHNSKAYKDAVRDWESANTGKAHLTTSDMGDLKAMQAAVMSHPVASKIMEGKGKNEIGIVWDDPKTGTLCKARVDTLRRVPSGVIDLAAPVPGAETLVMVDFKTTYAIGVDSFNKERAKWAYHGQIAFYHEGLTQVRPASIIPLIIAVQNQPPFDVIVCDMRELLDMGRALYRECLTKLIAGRRDKRWPGASDFVVPLHPFAWEESPKDEKHEEEE